MSMSQEEIESLMNGLDITENENSKDEEMVEDEKNSESMSEEDIESLIAQTNMSTNSDDKDDKEEESENIDNESIDDLLKELEDSDNSSSDISSDESIDDLLSSLENDKDDKPENNDDESLNIEDEEVDTSDIDKLLEDLKNDNTQDDYLKELDDLNIDNEVETLEELEPKKEEKEDILEDDSSERYKNVVSVDKINIPNQLGEVANDSEEKATKIFDALSYILDDNASLRKTVKGLDSFIQSQQKMLETLNAKFPNIKEFSDNLELVNSLIDMPTDIQTRLSNRDKELYEAMELMQFHDINRQKIERVMKIVVNLSKQLNDIFDDNAGTTTTMPVSKHLPGDNSLDIVGNDDLESLIAEFGK